VARASTRETRPYASGSNIAVIGNISPCSAASQPLDNQWISGNNDQSMHSSDKG